MKNFTLTAVIAVIIYSVGISQTNPSLLLQENPAGTYTAKLIFTPEPTNTDVLVTATSLRLWIPDMSMITLTNNAPFQFTQGNSYDSALINGVCGDGDDYTQTLLEVDDGGSRDLNNLTAGGMVTLFSFTSTPGQAAVFNNLDACLLSGVGPNTADVDPDGGGGPLNAVAVDFTSNTVLPIKVIRFTASRENERSSKLMWTTAEEINTSHFSLERSSDGQTWTEIGKVKAAGDNPGVSQYDFLDKDVYDGRSASARFYYRLQIVYRDGKSEKSNIEVVQFGKNIAAASVEIYPNPSTDGVNVEISSEDALPGEIVIYNNLGQLVYKQDIPQGSSFEYVDFAKANISSGTYTLKVFNSIDGILKTEKLVVQR